MKWGLSAMVVVATCSGISGGVAQAANPSPVPPVAQLEAGRKIYNFRCYFCHGYSGNAQTVATTFLDPRPVDFTRISDPHFDEKRIISVLQKGKPNTAMKSFKSVLDDAEMGQVAAFIMDEFVRRHAPNTHYHTPENGWPNHQRYHVAFPFATGEIPIDRPWEELTEDEASGKRLFMKACVICHDRGHGTGGEIPWEATPLSYPRNNYSNAMPPSAVPKLDAMASASPYLLHEAVPHVAGMTKQELKGEKLFQKNCAFCHAADGTGKNWVGSFLEPHPRNLRDPAFMDTMTRTRLSATIREGLPGTSMSAWKNVLNEKEIAAIVAYVAKAFYPLPE